MSTAAEAPEHATKNVMVVSLSSMVGVVVSVALLVSSLKVRVELPLPSPIARCGGG